MRLLLSTILVSSLLAGFLIAGGSTGASDVDLVCGALNAARGHSNKSPNAQAYTIPVANTCSIYYLGGTYVRNGSTVIVPAAWRAYGQFVSFPPTVTSTLFTHNACYSWCSGYYTTSD